MEKWSKKFILMKVFDAMDLVGRIDGEWNTIQRLFTDHTGEAG